MELEVLVIVMGRRKEFYPVLTGGGGRKKFSDPQFCHFVVLSLSIVNESFNMKWSYMSKVFTIVHDGF